MCSALSALWRAFPTLLVSLIALAAAAAAFRVSLGSLPSRLKGLTSQMTLAKVPDLLVKSPAVEVKSGPTWWLDRMASSFGARARWVRGRAKTKFR